MPTDITGTTLAVDILLGNRCSQCGHPVHGKGLGPVECYADEITNPPEPTGDVMSKIKITRRADGRLTLSGLDQEQLDSLVAALDHDKSNYHTAAAAVRASGKPADVELSDRLSARAELAEELAGQLKPSASPVVRGLAG